MDCYSSLTMINGDGGGFCRALWNTWVIAWKEFVGFVRCIT
jgi:hypothetical protein